MQPILLALDLAASTGYAHNLTSKKTCGVIRFKDDGTGFERCVYERMRRLLLDVQPDAVVYEQVMRHMGTHAAHRYGGYVALLQLACQTCFSRGAVEVIGVPVGTIKKYATGKGNAPKNAMIDAARLMGYDPPNHDAADAACILEYALNAKLVKKEST